MIIAVDFDGTCTTHDYPRVGKDIGAASVLKELSDKGHQLMLWTMRGNKPSDDGDTLADAVNWFKENDIPLWGINENPDQQATGWTNSNKQYAQLYIDDAALGAPLKYDPTFHGRAFVDWVLVREMLVNKGIL
jgi:hypothetical protein